MIPQRLSSSEATTLTKAYCLPKKHRFEAGDGPAIHLILPGGSRIIPTGTEAIAMALLDINEGPATAPKLSTRILDIAQGIDALKSASSLQAVLALLCARGVLHECLVNREETVVAELRHKGRLPVPTASCDTPADGDALVDLHPRTVLKREGRPGDDGCAVRGWVVDVGLAPASIWISDEYPASAPETWPPEVVGFARRAGLLSPSDPADPAPWWDSIDLIFHERTREAGSHGAYGGTRPFPGSGPSAHWEGADVLERVELPAPRPLPDVSLEEAMSKRHSTRAFAGAVSLDQLSDLLGHTVRARRFFRDDKGTEVLDKSVPAGGSIHEVETWVAIHSGAVSANTLGAGIWHYNCLAHALERIAGEEGADALLANTAAMSVGSAPPMTIVHTARFARLMWKYESVAYGLILKHVGVIHEAMQLTATALGLGTCVLGGGATSLFAETTGIDPLVEGVVGEMTLGLPEKAEPNAAQQRKGHQP